MVHYKLLHNGDYCPFCTDRRCQAVATQFNWWQKSDWLALNVIKEALPTFTFQGFKKKKKKKSSPFRMLSVCALPEGYMK